MRIYSGLTVLAVVIGICQSDYHHGKHFISTNNEILSALTWATLDRNLLPQESWMTYMQSDDDMPYGNITEAMAKPRRKRSLQLTLDGDIFTGLEIKFIVPLFQVYESTFIRAEVPVNFNVPIPFITANGGRAWDETYGPMMNRIEDLVSMLGVDGSACVKRSVCELAAAPSLRLHGLVGEVVQILIRRITEHGMTEDTEDNVIGDDEKPYASKGEYIKAGEHGREKGDCWSAFPECPFSLFNVMYSS